MGGAATAVVGDAAAGAWYNPATLAAMQGESFSASVGIYKKFDTQYGIGSDLISSALKANQGFFRALPSSTGSVIRPKQIWWLQDWTLTMSILVPEYDQFRGEINRSDTNVSTLALTDESLWAGGAMARRISSSEFFGFTLYYTARSLDKSVTDRTYHSPTDFKIFTEDRAIKQNAIVAILGYLKDLNENWKLGISVRLPSLHVLGRASYLENTLESGQAEQPKSFSDLDSKTRIPPRLNVGISYDDHDRWVMAAEVNAYGAEQYDDLQILVPGIAEKIEHVATLNASLGGEYKWTEWFKTRAGIFTNFSSMVAPDKNNVHGQGDRVNQLGFAANAAFRSGHIEYTFGGYYSGGQGEGIHRVDQELKAVTKSQNIFTMLVGTSYYF